MFTEPADSWVTLVIIAIRLVRTKLAAANPNSRNWKELPSTGSMTAFGALGQPRHEMAL